MSDAKPQDLKPQVEEEATWPLPKDIEEHLAVDPGKNSKNVWALKLPRFLLERWERVPEAGVELGTLVVDSSYVPFNEMPFLPVFATTDPSQSQPTAHTPASTA